MKKLRDFIYDYNDIFVALVIIVIAGALIFWRVGAIMSYPDYLASKQTEISADGDLDPSQIDLTPDDVDDDLNENPDEIDSETTPPDGSGGTGGSTGPTPPADRKFEVPSGSSADKVGDLLVQAGYISNKADFMSAIRGKETSVKAGSFTIPEGATPQEIAAILTK